MENASKAVLISGGIILALAVITIAMVVYTSGQSTVHSADIPLDQALVKMHNKEYLAYDKETLTGREVRNCITTALSQNSVETRPEFYVSITVHMRNGQEYRFAIVNEDGGIRTLDTTARVTSSTRLGEVDAEATYIPTINLGKNGIVQEIYFEQR